MTSHIVRIDILSCAVVQLGCSIMGTGREVPPDVQEAIVHSSKEGIPSNSLAKQFRLANRTVSKILRRFKTHGCELKAPRSRRPMKTTARQDRIILRRAKAYPRLTAVDIQQEIATDRELYSDAYSLEDFLAEDPVGNH
jgi:transposase